VIKSNKQIGAEIKKIRKALGISQMKLAGEIEVSFQQLQKYENGINKISVERIQQIAKALGISVHRFFEDEKVPLVSESSSKYCPDRERLEDIPFILNQEEINLFRLFKKIDNKKIREGLIMQLNGIIEYRYKEQTK